MRFELALELDENFPGGLPSPRAEFILGCRLCGCHSGCCSFLHGIVSLQNVFTTSVTPFHRDFLALYGSSSPSMIIVANHLNDHQPKETVSRRTASATFTDPRPQLDHCASGFNTATSSFQFSFRQATEASHHISALVVS